jgi:hypothetical protein
MPTNKLSVEITQEKDTAVQQLLDSVQGELDFLIDLSVEDRKRLSKMGRRHVDFVMRGLKHVEGSPQFIPPYMSLEEYRKDVNFSAWLRKVEKRLGEVLDMVKDTAMLTEAEAYQSARLYYKSVKAASEAGNEGAEQVVRDLAVHFKKLGASKTQETPTQEPQQ